MTETVTASMFGLNCRKNMRTEHSELANALRGVREQARDPTLGGFFHCTKILERNGGPEDMSGNGPMEAQKHYHRMDERGCDGTHSTRTEHAQTPDCSCGARDLRTLA